MQAKDKASQQVLEEILLFFSFVAPMPPHARGRPANVIFPFNFGVHGRRAWSCLAQVGDVDPTCKCLVSFSRLLPELPSICFGDDHKRAVGTVQAVGRGAGRKSLNHLCSPQEKSSFLLMNLTIPLAISKGIFEALTL